MRKLIPPALLLVCPFALACPDEAAAPAASPPSKEAGAANAASPASAGSEAPALAGAGKGATADAARAPVIDHVVEDIDGKRVSLASYRGKALLIVNTASECGFTPQYGDLERLYREYKDKGLEVLAFPSNDFGGQEPGSHEEIKAFTDETFDITFPLFAKVHTTGPEKAPLYKTLTEATQEGVKGEVKWNFTKFLVDPAGKVVARFESKVKPTDDVVKKAIEAALF